jgi:hypothetical protein
MELFYAILTGVFLWLFFLSYIESLRNGIREDAGKLIVNVSYSNPTHLQKSKILYFIALIFFIYVIVSASNREGPSIGGLCFSSIVMMTWLLLNYLTILIRGINERGLQLWERGIVYTKENDQYHRYHFIHWANLQYCKWVLSESKLIVQSRRDALDFYIAANQSETVIETIGRYVEIRDHNDKVLAAPANVQKENSPTTPKQKRSIFQFDLRTLMLLMLMAASGFSWYGIRDRHEQFNVKQLAILLEKHPDVVYELRGIEFHKLDYGKCRKPASDNDLIDLQNLLQLQYLLLEDAPISDAGLIHLESLTKLKNLKLGSKRIKSTITDVGLVHLKTLTSLKVLDLVNTRISDAGLEHISTLVELESLDLSGNNITDNGLVHLKTLTRLKVLDLENTSISDAGLEHISTLVELKSLDLSHNNITDNGLVHLKSLIQLSDLYINDTKITDAGLEHLVSLKKLESLMLFDTKVTPQGVNKLKQALPSIKKIYSPPETSSEVPKK